MYGKGARFFGSGGGLEDMGRFQREKSMAAADLVYSHVPAVAVRVRSRNDVI